MLREPVEEVANLFSPRLGVGSCELQSRSSFDSGGPRRFTGRVEVVSSFLMSSVLRMSFSTSLRSGLLYNRSSFPRQPLSMSSCLVNSRGSAVRRERTDVATLRRETLGTRGRPLRT